MLTKTKNYSEVTKKPTENTTRGEKMTEKPTEFKNDWGTKVCSLGTEMIKFSQEYETMGMGEAGEIQEWEEQIVKKFLETFSETIKQIQEEE